MTVSAPVHRPSPFGPLLALLAMMVLVLVAAVFLGLPTFRLEMWQPS